MAIDHLPNWKTAGIDKIYNFFIKKITSLHEELLFIINENFKENKIEADWYYTGVTYMIPKNNISEPKNLRPITCMPNLYKLQNKLINSKLINFIEINKIISENQMGGRSKCQGAKEQALFNRTIYENNKNMIDTAWLDIKKAYDSVNHEMLAECMKKLGIPDQITNYVKSNMEKWKVMINFNKEEIGTIKIKKGILQGDSLSPTLFTLVMEPLSRHLNKLKEKILVSEKYSNMEVNHLFFMDDIKLIANNKEELDIIWKQTINYLDSIKLEVNKEKTTHSVEITESPCSILKQDELYKYLGVYENIKGEYSEINKEKIKEKALKRVKLLCETKLNSKNLFKAINEFCLSTYNYFIGLLNFKEEEMEDINKKIREILLEYKIMMKTSNFERLYIKRDSMGRGLVNMIHKEENIMLNFYQYLNLYNSNNEKRRIIIEEEKFRLSRLAIIEDLLKSKYEINEETVNTNILKKMQLSKIMERIEEKILHGYMYKKIKSEELDMKTSSIWLKHGNITPQSEGMYVAYQDRNIFCGQKVKCPNCGKANISVDHMATRCGVIIHHSYKRRHDEVAKSLHLMLASRFKLSKLGKLRGYKINPVIENDKAILKFDCPIKTSNRIENNKPDIFLYDKIKNKIILIEVGITNLDKIKTVESEKYRKYDVLANELKCIYKAEVEIVPVVLTWEGVVTRYAKQHLKRLGVDNRILAYIQTVTIKKTIESISFNRRRNSDDEFIEGKLKVNNENSL
ncbi:MAG: reverse transcriptase family protein [Bacilli bacterium]